ncbi:MAG TPA: histidine kinase N-terminal 7TM domain-containing protein, partial [Thermoanaerobaculia bacterium]
MSIFGEIFSSSSYILTGLSVANGLTAAIVLLIGLAILLRGRTAPPAKAFFVITLASSAWLICSALMFSSRHPDLASLWARAAVIPVGVIAAAALHFTIRNLRPLQRRSVATV